MPLVAVLFGLFIFVPLVEVALFIEVGGWLGLWPTIACVIATALIGSFVIRLQGLDIARRAKTRLDNGDLPVREAFDGLCLVAAGILLILPGFFTDAVGACLLLPPVRSLLYGRMEKRIQVVAAQNRGSNGNPDGVIDVEYEVIETDDKTPPPGKGWGPKP